MASPVVLGRPSVVPALPPPFRRALPPTRWCRSAPASEPNPRDPRGNPGRTSEGTLPPCPQSAYASRVAPATSAWGWPPPPPCAAAPFTAPLLHAPSPPMRSLLPTVVSRLPPASPLSSFSHPLGAPLSPKPVASPRSNPRQSLPFSILVSRLRERTRRRNSSGGWCRRKRSREAPLEANRINVSRIIHAYFRDTRERGNAPSARANFNTRRLLGGNRRTARKHNL